ncbi:hypothetical protein [Mesorhizobium sp. IMUNJ 23232]|uniref:hypothetical protein n=1 Tax=Mesorhizobium sp. IMUNJ 23232 TaxID=3376064 RepID=UPI0037B51C12
MLANLEAWIRRRLRSYLWRQWGNGHNRYKELRRRGVPKFSATAAAGSPTGFWCQTACKTDPGSASKIDPLRVARDE